MMTYVATCGNELRMLIISFLSGGRRNWFRWLQQAHMYWRLTCGWGVWLPVWNYLRPWELVCVGCTVQCGYWILWSPILMIMTMVIMMMRRRMRHAVCNHRACAPSKMQLMWSGAAEKTRRNAEIMKAAKAAAESARSNDIVIQEIFSNNVWQCMMRAFSNFLPTV